MILEDKYIEIDLKYVVDIVYFLYNVGYEFENCKDGFVNKNLLIKYIVIDIKKQQSINTNYKLYIYSEGNMLSFVSYKPENKKQLNINIILRESKLKRILK